MLATLFRQIDRIEAHASRAGIAVVIVRIASEEVEGPRAVGVDADFLGDKIELVAVIGPPVTTEQHQTPAIQELVGETEARLESALERFALRSVGDVIVDVVLDARLIDIGIVRF